MKFKIENCRLLKWLFNETTTSNKNWYVFLSLFLSSIWVFISLWTLFVPVLNIQKNIEDLKYDFNKVFNNQVLETSKMDWWEIIKKYFEYLNSNDFQNACSFLSTRMCSLYSVSEFTKWVNDKNNYLTNKLRDWEKLENIWFSGEKLENTNSEIWCADVSFQMSHEDKKIKQVWQYTIATRPDWKKEIRRSLCEFSEKEWDSWNFEDRSFAMKCDAKPKYCKK